MSLFTLSVLASSAFLLDTYMSCALLFLLVLSMIRHDDHTSRDLCIAVLF